MTIAETIAMQEQAERHWQIIGQAEKDKRRKLMNEAARMFQRILEFAVKEPIPHGLRERALAIATKAGDREERRAKAFYGV
jgi:hypothetical protein